MNDAIRMQLSAYVDGELPENEAELLLRRMSQDAELRAEVAEYLALGRLMRAEAGLAGADRLHGKIAAVLDEHDVPVAADDSEEPEHSSRAVRPLVGAAIAAGVALVAIFALQQNSGVGEPIANEAPQIVENATVPSIDAQQERQRQYLQKHTETYSELGGNGMNARVVTLEFSEDVTEEVRDASDDDVEEASQAQ